MFTREREIDQTPNVVKEPITHQMNTNNVNKNQKARVTIKTEINKIVENYT